MSKAVRRIIHVFITLLLISLGIVGMAALKASKPKLEKQKPPTPLPVVRSIQVTTGPRSVIIRGEGTVRPLREISLVPQVSGKAISVSPALVDGGDFKKNDILLRIDPIDYQLAVTLAEAKVKDSESRLELAKEEAAVAREEWRLLQSEDAEEGGEPPPPLVAKEPQLAAARAKLEADQADLRKAILNLKRTVLRAPFDGRVSQENVDVGQYVTTGQSLATLYSTEAAEIVVPLEDKDLYWFHVPGFTPGDGPGATAEVRARIAGRDLTWPGEVERVEGRLDERTRMVDVVVRVRKPYARKPPLAIGLFVAVHIEGRTLPEAALIPRTGLRQGGVVWLVDQEGRLRFRKVQVAHAEGENVMIESGLQEGELVVISTLKMVTDGMAVRNVVIRGVNRS
jgi:RND family efflux transporter MFP subunit